MAGRRRRPGPAGYAFAYLPLDDDGDVTVGDVTVRTLATPDHTPEHTAYLVVEAGTAVPAAVFTGGSPKVGGEFVRARLSGLPRYPAYYRHMAPINRVGPAVLAAACCTSLSSRRVASSRDARTRARWTAGRVAPAVDTARLR